MAFLAPWFLGGLALLGLPFWLHLLQQHKNTPVPFPSLMFFEKRTMTSTRQRRLRYIALLVLRLLLLLLLAIAFAQPYFERNVPVVSGKRLKLIAVDNSFSMRRGASLEDAKRLALGEASGRAQVLSFGAGVREMGPISEDPAALRAAVAAITPGDERSSFAELARAARSIAEANRTAIELHLYSDLQKSSLPGRFADLQLPADAKLVVHEVGSKDLPNFYVESVRTPGRIFDPKTARLQATVASLHTGAATRKVSVWVDGRQVHARDVTIPAAGRATVEFIGLETPYGWRRGEVRIDGGDTFAADDAGRFAVERSDPRRIVLLRNPRDSRSEIYFAAALEAAASGAFRADAATTDTQPNLQNAAFVVLADPGALGQKLEADLREYVRGGGNLLIAVGPATAVVSKVPVSGLAVSGSRVADRAKELFDSVAKRDETHPVIEKMTGLETVKFYQLAQIEPGREKVLARTAAGQPVLLEQQLGDGRILLLASGLDNLGNNLPIHPAFLPFVERTAQYLSRQEESTQAVAVGETIELRAAADRAVTVEVLDAKGSRALSLDQAAKATSYQPPAEGFYEVRRSSGRQTLVAVNADRRESDFDRIDAETIVLWQATGAAESAASTAGAPAGQRREPWPLWPYLLFFLAAITIAESIYATRYLTREEAA
ncbi:MAG: BatA domain-containing protein [Acidobacteriota bacterium]